MHKKSPAHFKNERGSVRFVLPEQFSFLFEQHRASAGPVWLL